jgi:hypothetical protein
MCSPTRSARPVVVVVVDLLGAQLIRKPGISHLRGRVRVRVGVRARVRVRVRVRVRARVRVRVRVRVGVRVRTSHSRDRVRHPRSCLRDDHAP